jgi:hypothetical protein
MQGIFISTNGISFHRSKTKKALKEAASDPASVSLEATSMFGNEYDGPLNEAPDGRYTVVGPDPYTDRKWYATITVSAGQAKVS